MAASTRSLAWRIALAVVLTGLALPPLGQKARAAEVPMAFAGFGFTDSSGEPEDQRKIHTERLTRFKAELETGLSQSGKYRIVALTCPSATCGASDTEAAELATQAKEAGADFLLIGGIQKMSSLILWMKADVVDVKTNKTVFDKLITFRGDTDEAWVRAEEFLLLQLREMQQ
jgi:hypothetical protein